MLRKSDINQKSLAQCEFLSNVQSNELGSLYKLYNPPVALWEDAAYNPLLPIWQYVAQVR